MRLRRRRRQFDKYDLFGLFLQTVFSVTVGAIAIAAGMAWVFAKWTFALLRYVFADLSRLFRYATASVRQSPGQLFAGMASIGSPPPTTNKAIRPTFGNVFHWPSTGYCGFEVVGESNYQNALRSLASGEPAGFEGIQVVATLTPEDANRFDPYAVAVSVSGYVVGYLSRDDARSFRRRLGQKGLTGQATTCGAAIVGGGVKGDGTARFYGIRLDIKPFE